jgi:type IV pilus biogenesis protein CpaD/CtpE
MKRPNMTRLPSSAARAVLLVVLAATLAGCGATMRSGTTIPDALEAERARLSQQGFTQYAN